MIHLDSGEQLFVDRLEHAVEFDVPCALSPMGARVLLKLIKRLTKEDNNVSSEGVRP